ncbi:MAG: DUF2309 domain-containing protein [Syntrophothermus sp.]
MSAATRTGLGARAEAGRRGGREWSAADRAALRADLALAARILAPTWPLGTFIAVNPLGGLEERPFEEAVDVAGEVLGARGTLEEELFRRAAEAGRVSEDDLRQALRRRHPELAGSPRVRLGEVSVDAEDLLLRDLLDGPPVPAPRRQTLTLAERADPALAGRIDDEAAKWCAAFLDAGSGWPMPGRELGFYAAWRRLAGRDPRLPRAARRALSELPEAADDAALEALSILGVARAERESYLQAHLARLPGWAAHVRWRGEREEGIDLLSYLALRLGLEAVLLESAVAAPAARPALPPTPEQRAEAAARALGAGAVDGDGLAEAAAVLASLPDGERGHVWLDAYEAPYRRRLLGSLRDGEARPAGRPAAQLVCCIDARSEGLRRNLESLGPYETLGFAGFFAVAIRFRDLAGGQPSDLCPVLLSPQNEVVERPAPGAEQAARRRVEGLQALHGAEDGFHEAKEEALSPFTLAEAGGWLAGPLSVARTFAPGRLGRALESLGRRTAPTAPTALTVGEGFGLEERAALAEVALRMMGLIEGFGRLVVLCGHGSRTENNPYEAALACGACGGNAGGPNARTAAAIFNDPAVRERLAAEAGIEIPADTWFLAAEHDTTADRVDLLDLHLAPASHGEEIARLRSDLTRAGAANSAERGRSLPGFGGRGQGGAAEEARARGRDWAQVFPEWGLAGNAAFIVAPREVTAGLDLERRAFLHSYRAEADPDGSGLETILTAPLIVAQWINCQYYFSTVDPAVFGAGTKTIHNVVAGIGVLAGHAGDLQLGLPWQSVADGERLVHEPMRLLAVVQAPLERIESIIERHSVLGDLFGNGWVGLAARERGSDPWQIRERGGAWVLAHEMEED